MKTITKLLGLLILLVLFFGMATKSPAQGRKREGVKQGEQRNETQRRDHDNRNRQRSDYHDHYSSNHRYDYDHVDRNRHFHRPVRWTHIHDNRSNVRYVYYREYNVYFDCHRNVYYQWNGRRWITSAYVPDVIYRTDPRRVIVLGVDYRGDDFNFYLERRRPAYIQVRACW